MSMTLDPETERLAAAIAERTGEPIANVLKAAVAAHARAAGILPAAPATSEERLNAMLVIARRAAQRPVLDPRSPDEIIGYDTFGLPK